MFPGGVRVQLCHEAVYRIRIWQPRRNDHSGVLIGTGGTRRADWPVRALVNDISSRIDR